MEAISSELKKVIGQFNFEGEALRAEPYGNGHINDTYAVYCKSPGGDIRYILQRINTSIFKQPDELMSNVEKVTEFIKAKILEEGGDYNRETLNIIKTIDNKIFYNDESGFWRAYIFIENTITYDIIEEPIHLYYAGKAFGKFQKRLSDFPVDSLYYTIPDFHNTAKRFLNFQKSLAADVHDRAKNVQSEIDFVMDREADTRVIQDLIESNTIPLRVTHNDTKINNVLIDQETLEGICVIDLDTVMPGSILFDFGDAMRIGTSTAEEDEPDVSKVNFDIVNFENFASGFLEETKDSLTDKEIELLPYSAKMMTFECGVRFLNDYLDGDVYFKIHRDNHNLDRCRTQFKLVHEMEKNMDNMSQVIKKIIADLN